MYAEERQQAMTQLVAQRGRMSVNELADHFEVTTETVRRDLSTLEQLGLVRRVHGGALPADSVTLLEPRLSERDLANTGEKDSIARAALRFIPQHPCCVILDAGSTTRRLAEILPSSPPLTVFTNAVPIASHLSEYDVELHMLPGRVRQRTLAAVGVDTVAALDRIRADVAFIGANGITVEHGLSTPDHEEAATKSALIRAAERTIVLCDSTKVGVASTIRFAPLVDVDVLVTDAGLTEAQRAELEGAGVDVVVAE